MQERTFFFASAPGFAGEIRFGQESLGRGPTAYERLIDLLEIEKERSEDVQIDLRADKTLRYDEVQPVMKAITGAKIKTINLVAKLKD